MHDCTVLLARSNTRTSLHVTIESDSWERSVGYSDHRQYPIGHSVAARLAAGAFAASQLPLGPEGTEQALWEHLSFLW